MPLTPAVSAPEGRPICCMPNFDSQRKSGQITLLGNVLGPLLPITSSRSFMTTLSGLQPTLGGRVPKSRISPVGLQMNASQHGMGAKGLFEIPATSPRSFNPDAALPPMKSFALPPRSMSPVLALHKSACWLGPHIGHDPLAATCPRELIATGYTFGPMSVTVKSCAAMPMGWDCAGAALASPTTNVSAIRQMALRILIPFGGRRSGWTVMDEWGEERGDRNKRQSVRGERYE